MNLTHGTRQASAADNRSSGLGENHTFTTYTKETLADCQDGLKSRLRKKFEQEGSEESSQENAFYVRSTELSVTEDCLDSEYRHMERETRKQFSERIVSYENIFMGQTKRGDPIKTVLTKGVSGIGKTVLTQKFCLDWAKGRSNQDIQLLFPFTFRELSVLKDAHSLAGLLHHFFSESIGICNFEHLKVLLIFDGLDERKLPLNFTQTRVLTEATETASVDVLLVNLIRGNLLPTARLWISTRPAAANQIPAEYVSMVTVARGFTDAQKEQYFRKWFKDEQQVRAIITHIRGSYSLHRMSHIPAVCGIMATVLHHVMDTGRMEQLPLTLTQMCVHLLMDQMKNLKYEGHSETDLWTKETRWIVRSLGYQAFELLQKGKHIVYSSELYEQSLDHAASAECCTEIFSQIFRKEQQKGDIGYFFIQCFQEFLAALCVHLSFQDDKVNLLSMRKASLIKRIFKHKPNLERLLQSAVDQVLLSPDENTDLFLLFILGLSLPTNQSLLEGLLTQTESNSLLSQEVMKYINQKLNKKLPLERSMSMFYCLSEMSDQSLLEEVQKNMGESRRSKNTSPAHWSALAFLILSSEVEEFNLRIYCPSEDALLNLLPVVKTYHTVNLSHCNLSQKSCGLLSSVLCSSRLRHLDLSNNNMQDEGVKKLCLGLKSAPCKLETLSLSFCGLSQASCGPLSSVLCSSSLRYLDLSNNDLQDSGVKLLCSGLKSAPCRLESLMLSGCLVSVEGGDALASALTSSLPHLRELDLRYNHLGSSAEHLTSLCDDPQCPLDTLRLGPAGTQWTIEGSGLRKYYCDFSLDPNTLHCKLCLLAHNRRVTYVWEEGWEYKHHPERFTGFPQVLSSTGLTGRSYWEAEYHTRWGVAIAMSYRGIGRAEDCEFGSNEQSWCLRNINGQFSVCHNKRVTQVQSSFDQRGVGVFLGRVGVYLDSEAGSLSFYEVHDSKLSHLYTFTSRFTEPLFPGFGLGYGPLYYGESVSLVRLAPTADTFKPCLKKTLSFFCF